MTSAGKCLANQCLNPDACGGMSFDSLLTKLMTLLIPFSRRNGSRAFAEIKAQKEPFYYAVGILGSLELGPLPLGTKAFRTLHTIRE